MLQPHNGGGFKAREETTEVEIRGKLEMRLTSVLNQKGSHEGSEFRRACKWRQWDP